MKKVTVLGIDFETQGLITPTTPCPNLTEVGALLYEVDLEKPFEPALLLDRYCTLIFEPSYPPQSDVVVQTTGITDDVLKAGPTVTQAEALVKINAMMTLCDYAMAHNKFFDQRLYEAQLQRHHLPSLGKPWICSYLDVPYPEKFTCKKLGHLALDHGLSMDGRTFHRAEDDVSLMMELVCMKYDFKEVLAYYKTPWIYIAAEVSFQRKDEAASRGYGWQSVRGDTQVFPKKWVKRIKETAFEKEKSLATFPVVRVG